MVAKTISGFISHQKLNILLPLARYLLIIPSLLQLYASHQSNKLVTRTVEYTVKQFYLMNRKPFILQMFGSASAILDTDDNSQFGDAHKVTYAHSTLSKCPRQTVQEN